MKRQIIVYVSCIAREIWRLFSAVLIARATHRYLSGASLIAIARRRYAFVEEKKMLRPTRPLGEPNKTKTLKNHSIH